MTFAENASFLLTLIVLCGSGVIWSRIFRRWQQGKRALPFHRSALAKWGLMDVVVLLLSVTVWLSLLSVVAKLSGSVEFRSELQTPRDLANSTLLLPLAEVLGIAVTVVFIALRTRSTARDFGWTNRIGRQLAQGLVAFFAIAAPTYLVLAVSTWLYRAILPEQVHPLIKLLQDSPSTYFFVIGGISAVLLAPVAEEMMFRVIVQGWLESVAERFANKENWVESLLAADPESMSAASSQLSRPRYWPIVATSLLFAMAHFGQGPAPIPLFFFSLGLGYLYQFTHRVLPCIVVHMTLNGLTMILLWAQTRSV